MGVGFAKDGEGAGRNNRNMLLNQREKYFKKQNYKRKQKNSLKYKSASEGEKNNPICTLCFFSTNLTPST